MDGAPGRGSGLLDGHDALPTQDQAQAFHDPRAAVDGPMDRCIGAAGQAWGNGGLGDVGSLSAMNDGNGCKCCRSVRV